MAYQSFGDFSGTGHFVRKLHSSARQGVRRNWTFVIAVAMTLGFWCVLFALVLYIL